jgi:precorrin-8X/cobalt-precorrin-8 methylmutase
VTHPIEKESFRILDERLDLGHLTPGARAVVARVVHASADVDLAASMRVDDGAVDAGVAAVRRGAAVVVDVEMVRAGIAGYPAVCMLGGAEAGPGGYPTRSAMAIRSAAARFPDGAVWVIGCAPTALAELVRLVEAGEVRPALVIGVPVGFVGAAEAKAAAARLPVPVITNVGEKGGSAVAAAAFNAIRRLAVSSPGG